MRCRRSIVGCALALTFALASPAHADRRNNSIERGIALYDDLEYEAAIEVLEKTLEQPSRDRTKNVDGFKALAMSYLALGQDDRALKTFERLLEIEPRYRLPSTVSEQAQQLFERARRHHAETHRAPEPLPPKTREVVLEQTLDGGLQRGRAAQISVRVARDPDHRHRRVVVYHRQPGHSRYSSVWARSRGNGGYEVTIAGGAIGADRLQYYVLAVDQSGERVGAIGSPDEPLEAAVTARAVSTAGPVYARWWFWAGVGSALVAGVIVADRFGTSEDMP